VKSSSRPAQAVGDINMNPRLRLAIDKAKAANMPADNIKRNVDKATGNLEGVNYEEIRYEGYGIGGAAIMVDCMTDNRVRTVAEVRHAFSKYGGNMGTEGSVAFQFKHCGQFIFAPGASEDRIMEVALEAGAEDVIADEEGAIEVLCPAADFEGVKKALELASLWPELAEVTMRTPAALSYTGFFHSASTMRVQPFWLRRGSMPDVIFSPRVRVRRTWLSPRIPLASRVLKSAERTSSRVGTLAKAIAWAEANSRSR